MRDHERIRNLDVRNLNVTDSMTMVVNGVPVPMTPPGASAPAAAPATPAVTSVAGRNGDVVLTAADIQSGLGAAATSNKYSDLTGLPTIPAVVGGKATITGTGVVASGLNAITSVVACLGQDASLAAGRVTATWSGTSITFKVWKPTSALDGTPLAATAPAVVNWIATGS